MASSSTAPSTARSSAARAARGRLVAVHERGIAVRLLVAAAAAAAAPAAAAALGRVLVVAKPAARGLRDGRPASGSAATSSASRRLAREDGVDELGLAQAAEAVDAELVGEQVQVGERALLQGGAVQDGGHEISSR